MVCHYSVAIWVHHIFLYSHLLYTETFRAVWCEPVSGLNIHSLLSTIATGYYPRLVRSLLIYPHKFYFIYFIRRLTPATISPLWQSSWLSQCIFSLSQTFTLCLQLVKHTVSVFQIIYFCTKFWLDKSLRMWKHSELHDSPKMKSATMSTASPEPTPCW